jgi:hypothetical protein
MRFHRAVLVAFAAAILVPAAAFAQAAGIFGVTSGLFLNGPSAPTPAVCPAGTCCNGTDLTLSEGNYELATGTPFALSHAVSLSNQVYNTCGAVDGGMDNCRQPPLEFGTALVASTVYYCYLNQSQLLFCSTKSPWPSRQWPPSLHRYIVPRLCRARATAHLARGHSQRSSVRLNP